MAGDRCARRAGTGGLVARAKSHRRRRRREAPVARGRRICLSRSTHQKPKTDLAELTLPVNIKVAFPEGKDKVMHFEITISPDEGMYRCVCWADS